MYDWTEHPDYDDVLQQSRKEEVEKLFLDYCKWNDFDPEDDDAWDLFIWSA